jgi:hemerythrin
MFEWEESYGLGFGAMDDTHHEFVECVDAMLVCTDDALPAALDRFAEHAQQHFDEEQRWMSESGFPSAGCHLDEHAAVLKSVAEVREVVRQGRLNVARALARELMRWFPGHAEAMDKGLANWMATQRLGGAPVLIRRTASQAL